MATAEPPYVDPSALLKLYLHEPQSRAMAAWRAKISAPLPVTHHGRVEMINGIALAGHRGLVTAKVCEAAWAALEDDFEQGRYRQADVLWRATLGRAAELSRLHSLKLGTRSLDVLHVACALELGARQFVTFDVRQQALVRAVGLKLVVPAA